ncbi:hypothetical protein LCGC14_2892680 [marine sediment metagenome]|uniref:Methyltransferase domain-containing protein n=1 Tax=marine sediment metagenome TaxID=412755 RepID=A0A0F8XWR7_9ZZZZ
MKYFDLEDQREYNHALRLADLIHDELKLSEENYGNLDAKILKKYYSNFLKSKNHFLFAKHLYALRISYLIKHIQKDYKVLDAACGIGTEAIISGLLGCQVDGIDINKSRLNLARKRLEYYNKKSGKHLNVDFTLKNIFSHLGKYDIIWLNEAISHIAPLHQFLKICRRNLKNNGKIIIADSNNINPYIYNQRMRAQKLAGGIYIRKNDPNSEKELKYAVERFFTIYSIKNLLSKYFEVSEAQLFGYFPFFVFKRFNKICKKIEIKFINKIPLIKSLAIGYVIVCFKN